MSFRQQSIPRNVIRVIPIALLVSVGLGITSYFLVSSLILWTMHVADEEGHGPDPGSLEWQAAIAKTTEIRHNRAIGIAVAFGTLSLPLSLAVLRQSPCHRSSLNDSQHQ